MDKVIVVGGGAAGIMAAISAAESGDSVLLIEKNEKLGKKIYITGKGRCNITNDSDVENLLKNVRSNPKFLYSAFYTFDSYRMMDFLESEGLKIKTERGNRVFPESDKSSDVIRTLKKALEKRKVKILLNTKVNKIPNVGAPQVAYRETIRKEANQETKYARQSGGKGQYGHVKIKIEPNEPGKGYEFVNAIVGGAIPKEYIPAIDNGIQGAMKAGVLAGYPVVDVKVTLWDGSYHEVDSSEMAFSIAGSMAFKDAMRKADPIITEPIMKVAVIVPDEYLGDVIGDLNARRGQIQGMEAMAGTQRVNAFVPLAQMFGYATDLRSKTQGRGQYVMEPSHYEPVPKNIADQIIAGRTKG